MAAGSLREASLPRFALRREEAAASLSISPSTFDQWVKDGRMPQGHKIDSVRLWDTDELRLAWIRLTDGATNDEDNPFDGVVA